jgi:PPOX class probable F420-dependent enzyme
MKVGDMSIQLPPPLESRLREEKVAWLTTVGQNGRPYPAPVWFLWDGQAFLIYSQPPAL